MPDLPSGEGVWRAAGEHTSRQGTGARVDADACQDWASTGRHGYTGNARKWSDTL